MSEQNVEVVRRMYETFHRGDTETALTHFDPEVVADFSVRVDAGVGQGREELNAIVMTWVGAFDDWQEEIEEMVDGQRGVLVISTQRGRGKGSGVEVDNRYATVHEIREGKISKVTLYGDISEARRAAGLSD